MLGPKILKDLKSTHLPLNFKDEAEAKNLFQIV